MSPATKILIIDDDPDLVEALKIILEAESYQVVSAFDGKEGLKRVKEEKSKQNKKDKEN